MAGWCNAIPASAVAPVTCLPPSGPDDVSRLSQLDAAGQPDPQPGPVFRTSSSIFGLAGAQLTRASVVASLRLPQADRLWLRGSYTYLSPLAINLFLAQWVCNRAPNGTTLGGGGIVENNLTILHHPARGATQYRHKPDRQIATYGEGAGYGSATCKMAIAARMYTNLRSIAITSGH